MKQPVIDPDAGRNDPDVGDYARLLRSPDIRIVGLRWERWSSDGPFLLDFSDPGRAYFYYVKRGGAFFRTGKGFDEVHYIGPGTAVGIEGRAHQWMDRSQLEPRQAQRAGPLATGAQDFPVEIALSSIDRRAAVLQRLKHGTIIIPPTALPHAAMIRGCVELIDRNQLARRPEPGISRRLAEVIMLELVAFARAQAMPVQALGGALHDEYLLRALSAFFAAPGAQWTVIALAEAAGLSRTAFTERFHKAFGEPPLRMINRLRLQLGAEMLLNSRAPLGEIATEIGFGSPAAFVRAFKRLYDRTPGEWRSRGAPG